MRFTVLFAALAIALLATGPVQAQTCDEQVVFETFPGTIVCRYVQGEFNCCASLDISVVVEGFSIVITETEWFQIGPCFCLCCFDSEVTVSGLAPGIYTVELWKAGPGGQLLVGSWDVDVDGEAPTFVETLYIPCVDTMVDDEVHSWGTIKALYRE